ncbi:MAG: Lipopolysaccharide core heptosyltransferase RfaQ [Candidatus Anoxychlamydiales bacterium]|nr:Lipopolysaccharide core heptosyltransferase RfaQ [Candidatus Anoxychlamydiales bacterium]NGX36022.1 Lipopolysaccharide core heptosyltransferase RfaQ [Candidatus Anoxychlamydiales bacterium]
MSYTDYIDFRDVKKILVIKLRHLGDVLLTTPVFYNLKKINKDISIDAFVYDESFDILKNNENIDEIITYDRSIKKFSFFKRLTKEIEIILKIRKKKYDLIINLTEGDRGAIISFFSKAKYKVGIDPKKTGFFKKEKIYTHIVKSPKTKRHTVERNLDAIRRVGIFPKEEDKKLEFNIPKKAKEKIQNILSQNNISIYDYILIHPTTRWRFKGFDKFDQLVDYFYKKNLQVVLVSGKEKYEIEMVDKIKKDLPILNLAGKVALDELAALILFSKSFYCLDSLSFHLANALKAKVFGFFGPTCDLTWGIWQNEKAKIISSKKHSCRPCSLDGCAGSKVSDCLMDISLKDVLNVSLDNNKASKPKNDQYFEDLFAQMPK